jgi:tyrosyl-tRNA synthetase
LTCIVSELFATIEDDLADILVKGEIVESKTAWRRLVEEGAVKEVEGDVVADPKIKAKSATFKIGKKRFVKIVVGLE